MIKFALIVAFLCVAALVPGRLLADEKKFDPPTPEEVKKTLNAYYKEQYSKDWGNAKVEKITVDITEPKIGEVTERQMNRGKLAQPVYPARAVVKISVKYIGSEKVYDTTIGEGSSAVFFFYKNAFKEWTFKTGDL